ncbi:MAG: HEAT repeat domain-containing protein, partial [Planctomycetaceae bacterium]
MLCLVLGIARAESPSASKPRVEKSLQGRCLAILKAGLQGEDFWPSIHAAEGLTLGGQPKTVIDFLQPKLAQETDTQKRCGLARELVRAGAREHVAEMIRILRHKDPHGHVHAAESLYKVHGCGNGRDLERAWKTSDNMVFRLMAAAALARSGRGDAL